ncbi:MAG: hypothetical protein OEY01_00395 [Desulfobulbaceae bacterium]|nr:hypothetical protein [Desulfobulbaceae bacterium]HIJ77750.1 hypothetical protein [Deltaproteobacteria bacterium]
MQKIMIVSLLLAFGVGCTGGVYSDLAEVELRAASPILGLGAKVPVVYPAAPFGEANDPLAQAFGPEWASIEQGYPAYNFNP